MLPRPHRPASDWSPGAPLHLDHLNWQHLQNLFSSPGGKAELKKKKVKKKKLKEKKSKKEREWGKKTQSGGRERGRMRVSLPGSPGPPKHGRVGPGSFGKSEM